LEGDGDALDEDRSMDVFRYQAHEMFYSVMWNTEDKHVPSSGLVDIASREELWLAKLGAWTEALSVYEEKIQRDPNDFESVVGCMRCLSANGEWRKVLDLASENWQVLSGCSNLELSPQKPVLSSVSQRKAVRMCAQSAWRLSRWDDLEKYSSQLVHGREHAPLAGSVTAEKSLPVIDFDGAFYSAVLHVHRKEWTDAANLIDAARKAMDGRLTALMAESYRRAYKSMVTAQSLAELEEVVEFRLLEENVISTAVRHPTNRHSAIEARKNLLSVWRKRLAGCRADAEVHANILAIRSLVLGPIDEVDSILTLSELSRQSQRYKFAERVLLDGLEGLHADIDGPVFGFRGSNKLRINLDFESLDGNSLASTIDTIVVGDLSSILPSYGPSHEQQSKYLVEMSGGLDRYV
jgi:serine/threonine-protein kinase mTOR